MIQVRDTGKGIPETFYETIFEPFRQVELGDTRNHGGTGEQLGNLSSRFPFLTYRS
jgi:signal transduction histidine kinase